LAIAGPSETRSERAVAEPTIFEHIGGAEALRRLADAQYRRCLADPVLSDVFGTEGKPDHVEHLAAWLGEVFGGPDTYTREYGGHAALLRHHANLAITETQRQRFIEVFLEAADEAGLPADDRFRTRFGEYLEWGTQIAVAVSQPGADTSSSEPVPRWGWTADGRMD
jgi:hemoglobin